MAGLLGRVSAPLPQQHFLQHMRRRRHGFEDGGTNSGAERWKRFLTCPQNLRWAPKIGGTAGAHHSGKKSTFSTCCRGLDIFQLGTDIPIL